MSERPFNPYEGGPTILMAIAEWLCQYDGGDSFLDYLEAADELFDLIFRHEEFPCAAGQRQQEAFAEMPA